VPWLRRLAAGLLPRKLGFDPGVSPCRICGGQNGTRRGFSTSTSFFPCQIHFTVSPLLGKGQKNSNDNNHHCHLHHRVAGLDASVASAAGHFSTKIKLKSCYGILWCVFFFKCFNLSPSASSKSILYTLKQCHTPSLEFHGRPQNGRKRQARI
jgi:hypothetical protein